MDRLAAIPAEQGRVFRVGIGIRRRVLRIRIERSDSEWGDSIGALLRAPADGRGTSFWKCFLFVAQQLCLACESDREGTMDSRGGGHDLLLFPGIISPFPVACEHQAVLHFHSFADGAMP